ncbi:MAG: SRPBCC family protein [Zavarzinella sp.]
MKGISLEILIDADYRRVFQVVADPRIYADAIPDVIQMEVLSEPYGVIGTRVRDTRKIGDQLISTEMEVVDYHANRSITTQAIAYNCTWTNIFEVNPEGYQTLLTLQVDFEPHQFFTRILIWMMRGTMRRALQKELIHLKNYCELSIQA